MTILVDSDVLIEVFRGRNTAIVDAWSRLSESEHILVCSPIALAELWRGARPKEFTGLVALFDALPCIATDRDTGKLAGDYLRTFNKSHNVELADALVAATAVIRGATLWTRNRKHYPMPALRFYEP